MRVEKTVVLEWWAGGQIRTASLLVSIVLESHILGLGFHSTDKFALLAYFLLIVRIKHRDSIINDHLLNFGVRTGSLHGVRYCAAIYLELISRSWPDRYKKTFCISWRCKRGRVYTWGTKEGKET